MFTVLLPVAGLASFYLHTMRWIDGVWHAQGKCGGAPIAAIFSKFMSPDDTPEEFGYCRMESFEWQGKTTQCNKLCMLY